MSYSLKNGQPRLPFPTRKVGTPPSQIEIYIIPDNEKEAVLEELYPFVDVPPLTEERFDLHMDKKFIVKDFMVTRENGMNFLVSPYYLEGGGSVIDWMPADFCW